MIFMSKKAFEEKMYERISEANFHARTEEELFKLKDEMRELKYRLDAIEQHIKQPIPTVSPGYEPAPYWTNPSWKAPDITCTTAEAKE